MVTDILKSDFKTSANNENVRSLTTEDIPTPRQQQTATVSSTLYHTPRTQRVIYIFTGCLEYFLKKIVIFGRVFLLQMYVIVDHVQLVING